MRWVRRHAVARRGVSWRERARVRAQLAVGELDAASTRVIRDRAARRAARAAEHELLRVEAATAIQKHARRRNVTRRGRGRSAAHPHV